MQCDAVLEIRRRTGALAQVLRQPRIETRDVASHRVRRTTLAQRSRHLQRPERSLVAARALERKLHHLRMSGRNRYPDVAVRAVDLPQQPVAIAGGAAAV